MKIDIVKNTQGEPIGWSITGETKEDKETVNTMRDLQFFGFNDTAIKYNGRTNGDHKDAGTLHWKQKKYCKED